MLRRFDHILFWWAFQEAVGKQERKTMDTSDSTSDFHLPILSLLSTENVGKSKGIIKGVLNNLPLRKNCSMVGNGHRMYDRTRY